MTTIAAKFNAFGADLKNAAQAAKDAAQNAALQAKNGFVKAAGFTGSVITDPNTQQKVEQGFRSAVDTAYGAASSFTNKAVAKMENEGVNALRTPIEAMKDLNIARLDIREDMSSNSKALRNTANKLIGYHENVIKASENVSRKAGDKTHAIVRLALTPIRFVAKILQIESVGAMIQNSVALAAGFIVRGLVMSIMQLGHVLPYAAAAAVVGGAAFGLAALAVHVSPLAAVGVGIGLVLMAQQAQILTLGKKVDALTNAIRSNNQAAQQSNTSALRNKLSSILAFLGKNKGKIAAGIAVGTAGIASYYFGGKAVELATPYARDAANYVADTQAYQTASEYTTSAYKATSEFVAPYAATVSEKAGEAATAVSGFAQSVASRVVDLFGTAKTAVPESTFIGSKAYAAEFARTGIASKAMAAAHAIA